MARLKGRALKGPLGATHNTAIPQIDVTNAPTSPKGDPTSGRNRRSALPGLPASQDLFDRVFAALVAPLDPGVLLLGGGSEWWTVLGVSRSASRAEIVNAYRALAKVHHPDVGGDVEEFKRLRSAYEAAMGEK